MKDAILSQEEVGKRLTDIIHTCGYEGIDTSSIVRHSTNKYDILLDMRNGQRINLKNALKIYSDLREIREKAHHTTELYLKLDGMPYSDFEKITRDLSIEQIKKLSEEADEINEISYGGGIGEPYSVKTVMPIMDREGKIIGAYIENEVHSRLEEQDFLGDEIENIEQEQGIEDNNQTNPVDVFKVLRLQLEDIEDKKTSSLF